MISSTRNPRIVRLRKLGQRKYRQREGVFIAEGLQALHMALEAGHAPQEVFYCEELFAGEGARAALERFRGSGAEMVEVSTGVMEALSERDAPQGLVAVFPFVERPLEELEVAGDDLVLVLDRLQTAGNTGTLLRTADAAGAGAVVLLEPCVDPYDRGAVRSSMGSLFNVPLARTDDARELFAWLRECGLRSVGADPHRGAWWHRAGWQGGAALVLGNEARGLSEDVRPHIDSWVRLPMRGRADSLNVAVVGGVLVYAWVQAHFDA